jgi:hypothetical protein
MENAAGTLVGLIVDAADGARDRLWPELKSALVKASLFVKVTGVEETAQRGERIVAGPERALQMRNVRLQNGLKMIFASVVPPHEVAVGETVATLAGFELCSMVMKTDADGLLVSAEDPRRSWIAIKRDEIVAMLDGASGSPLPSAAR